MNRVTPTPDTKEIWFQGQHGHAFIFRYVNLIDLCRACGRYASESLGGFTWLDAAHVTQRARKIDSDIAKRSA